jgi:acetoin utilization deacetylase AcuC-like enzyme
MGFCLFNNVAIAAEHAIAELGCRRVLILDPDVHHGNGTQHAFYGRRDVLYVSSHRYPFYPGTGWFDEVGVGEGEGFSVNLPLPPGMGDAEFLHLYEQVVSPIVGQYRPDLILVSAGFDTWREDPLGGMRMTEPGYAALFGLFKRWADDHCPGRIAAALEGGYDPAGLVAGVRSAIGILAGSRAMPAPLDAPVLPPAREIAAQAKHVLGPFWSALGAS